MADYRLQIKDGNGEARELYADSGSNGIIPYHAVSGAVAMKASDLASLTGSINAVSSAVGIFNEKLYQALTGGPVSMSVDIVAGDVNTLTQSINTVTAEVAKLTALSGSGGEGLLVRGDITASINNWPVVQQVTSSATNPVWSKITGTVTTSENITYAEDLSDYFYDYTELTSSAVTILVSTWDTLTLTIQNNTDSYLYIGLFDTTPTTGLYHIRLEPYSTYEAAKQNASLDHNILLDPAATKGKVSAFATY